MKTGPRTHTEYPVRSPAYPPLRTRVEARRDPPPRDLWGFAVELVPVEPGKGADRSLDGSRGIWPRFKVLLDPRNGRIRRPGAVHRSSIDPYISHPGAGIYGSM
jgi:hypothetical protein